jgi:hypothetical protein
MRASPARATDSAWRMALGDILGRRAIEVSVVPEVDAVGKRVGGYVAYSEGLREADGRLRGGPADLRLALVALAMYIPGLGWKGLRREMAECRARAEALLDAHWPTVQKIAGELLWTRHLDRQQIEDLL